MCTSFLLRRSPIGRSSHRTKVSRFSKAPRVVLSVAAPSEGEEEEEGDEEEEQEEVDDEEDEGEVGDENEKKRKKTERKEKMASGQVLIFTQSDEEG